MIIPNLAWFRCLKIEYTIAIPAIDHINAMNGWWCGCLKIRCFYILREMERTQLNYYFRYYN